MLLLQTSLVLLTLISLSLGQELLELRLVNGGSSHIGNVQVRKLSGDISSDWLFICDDGFGFAEADAACRELGFEGADRFTRNDYFKSIDPKDRRKLDPKFLLDRYNCSMTNSSYSSCPADDVHDCAVSEIAGVECRTSSSSCDQNQFACRDELNTCISREEVCDDLITCPDASDEELELCTDVTAIRLMSNVSVHIPGAAMGSVQLKHNQQWGTICDDGTSKKEAEVICRGLGYKDGWSVSFSGSYLGEAIGPMILYAPECTGLESWIGECPGSEFGPSACPMENEDFGVFCYDGGVEFRLTGSDSRSNGQVEFKLAGQWGNVCDSGFDILDAQVICRMLGYDGDAVAYRRAGLSGTGSIWSLHLDCIGKEQDIQDCRIRIIEGTCPLSHTAGVTCSRSRGTVDAALRAALGNKECGIAEDSSDQLITRLAKVRGGIHRSRFDAPWLISLRRVGEREGRLYCGGSIISEDYIITAGHCLDVVGRLNVVVRVGDYNSNFKEDSEEDFLIDKAWTHEYEDEHSFNDNDIALIKIERKNGRGIKFGERVKPICLPSVYDNYDNLVRCIVTGWGPTFFLNDPESRPREGRTNIISDDICEGSIGGPKNYTSSHICVGRFSPRVNACKGDSGGPLSCPVNGRQTLYGLVSSGTACTFRASADLYTRVTKYLDWILDKVQLSKNDDLKHSKISFF